MTISGFTVGTSYQVLHEDINYIEIPQSFNSKLATETQGEFDEYCQAMRLVEEIDNKDVLAAIALLMNRATEHAVATVN